MSKKFSHVGKKLDPEKHFDHLRKLIELEEAEEIRQFKEVFVKRTPEERELLGKALLRLRISESHFSPAGHRLLSFRYESEKPLPLYSPDVGDPVSLSDSAEDIFDLPTGTVYQKDKETITVAFGRKLPEWVSEAGLYTLNISGNRMTYKKMYQTLEEVAAAKHSRPAYFRDLSLGLKKPESYDPLPIEKISFFNSHLNPWQKEAVQAALASRDISIVHGPPGTGKTTVLIEIIRQAIATEQFVFATAPSNTACDHILECLVKAGVPALRLGHPARIMEHLRVHTLDFKLAHHPLAKQLDELESEVAKHFTRYERSKRRRSLSRDEKTVLFEEINRIKAEIRGLDDQIFRAVIRSAPVMVGTHTSATDPVLRARKFDLLVMDEASQATEPSAWIPVLKAGRIVLAGDHYQLPPTVISKEAERRGLAVTLFERFHKLLGKDWRTLLKIQYRMNEKIMNFPSREFYGGELVADDSVKHHTLADLKHVKRLPETEEPFLFLDTAGRGFEEALEPGSESRYNREEAALLMEYLQKILDAGVSPEDIAVISPYSAQVRLLASLILAPEIEVDSVDGFQGREKEVIMVSLVRSNVEGELGFLADTRRMNVAMTRAKRKLVMIGDSATLSAIPFYRDFIQYAESISAYRSSWEII